MNSSERSVLVMAHRGANNLATENTLKAFQKAIELGADYIEFDVRESKDNEIVVIHDEDTFRITGHKGLVKEMTLRQLKKLDFGDGEKILTLTELINATKGKISLNCEVKVEGIAKKIVDIFHRMDIVDSLIISSFSLEELIKIQKIDRNIKLALIISLGSELNLDWESKKYVIDKVIRNKLFAINPLYKLVDKQFMDYAHKHKLKVYPWTVNSKIAMKKLIDMSVDGIITNDILQFKKVLNE